MSFPSTLQGILPNDSANSPSMSTQTSQVLQDANTSKPKSTRRSVACKSCHTLKVKCIPVDESDPGGPCVRCVNANRECEINLNQTKKRRKRAASNEPSQSLKAKSPDDQDEYIAQLQEQIKILKAQIHEQNNSNVGDVGDNLNSPDFGSPPFVSKTDLEKEIIVLCGSTDTRLTELTCDLNQSAERRADLLCTDVPLDVVSCGLVDINEAEERLKFYKTQLYTAHPLICIPDDLTAAEMQKSQPLLLNAVISVTTCISPVLPNSGTFMDQDKALNIDNLAVRSITHEIMVMGTKSVELIKSLLLLSLWYNTPEIFRNRRYHLFNSLAVSLLHDLGVVGRPIYSFKKGSGLIRDNIDYTNTTYLSLVMVLYLNTVGICLVLRRSIYVKWTPFVEDCCKCLEDSGNKDLQRLAVVSRLSHELERIHYIVHSPEVGECRGSPSHFIIRELQKNLTLIKFQIKSDDYALLAYYFSVEAYLHEPILSDVFNEEAKPEGISLNDHAIKSILKCTTSCLNALDVFLLMTPEKIAKLPLVYSTRIIYTVGMLLRLRYLILSLSSNAEKDLVPKHAICTIQKLVKLVDEASNIYRLNHFLKKTRLVLQLFIQTYATQAKELLKRKIPLFQESNIPQIPKSELSAMNKLNDMITRQHSSDKVYENGQVFPRQFPLDILSYAASYSMEKKTEGMQEKSNNKPRTPSKLKDASLPLYNNNDIFTLTPDSNMEKGIIPNIPKLSRSPSLYDISTTTQPLRGTKNISKASQFDQNIVSPDIESFDLSKNLANADQLESSYLALNDEFWSDLLNNKSHPINFSNNNLSSENNDEVFYMN